MAAITLTLLTKYAEEHFPDDFANLPKVNDYSVKRGLLGGFTMHSGNHLLASVSISGLLSCYHSSIKGHEPFCWIETSQKVNENAKLDAFVQFCFMVEGYTCWTKVSKKGFILHFKSACADIAKGMLAKELAEALARVSDVRKLLAILLCLTSRSSKIAPSTSPPLSIRWLPSLTLFRRIQILPKRK